MTIKAFLGHSFTDDDKDLVIKITEFLDAQRNAHTGFEWVHATQAKPMGVVEKVLPLIRESDIFIGLCTRKERVVSPSDLKTSWWNKSILQAQARTVDWKTSDWIIQEIGIAIQRDMKVILLLERGVRKPGGLIGDLEYISFDRNNLAQAFTSMTQMLGGEIQKLSSPSLGISGPPSQVSTSQEQLPEAKSNDPKFEPPQPDWDANDYEQSLITGILFDNKPFTELIFKTFLDSPLGKTSQATTSWHATREYFLLVFDQGGKIEHLEELVNEDRSNPLMVRMLALTQSHLGNREVCGPLFEEAADAEATGGSIVRQADSLSSAANAYIAIGAINEAERVLTRINALAPSSPELEAIKLYAAGVIAKTQEQTYVRIAALERRIALTPTDIDDRFALAYLYGELVS